MGTLHGVAHQPGAVERCRGGDAVGIARGGSECVGATYAIAVNANWRFAVHLVLADCAPCKTNLPVNFQ